MKCSMCGLTVPLKSLVQDVTRNGDVLRLCPVCAAKRTGRYKRTARPA